MSSRFTNWRLVFRAGRAVSLTALVLALAAPLSGQGTPAAAQLGNIEAAYEVASSEHTAAAAAFDRAFTLWEQASDRVGMARASQNGDELEDALAEFQVRAVELSERERELSQAASRLNGARARYRRALEGREEEILALLETSRPATVERALMSELVQVRDRVESIEEAAGSPETIVLRPVPELEVDPRDSLDDLFAKENLMQDVAASYDTIIVDLQAEVAGLERQLQRAQSFEELRRSVDRFGGAFVPGAALPPPPPADAGAADPSGGGASALTAESVQQRIAHLRETIALAERYRDQAQVRAGLFRQQAESMQQ